MIDFLDDLDISEQLKEKLKRIRCCVYCESSTDEDTGEQVVNTGLTTTLEGFLNSIGAEEKDKQKIYGSCDSSHEPLNADTEIIIESNQK